MSNAGDNFAVPLKSQNFLHILVVQLISVTGSSKNPKSPIL